MSNEWYYAKGNQQLGPVTAAQLKQLATSGQLSPEDLIWREGMANWESAGKVRGLFVAAAQPVAAVAPAAAASAAPATGATQDYAVAPDASPQRQAGHRAAPQSAVATPQGGSPIGYYSPTGGMPARTATILKGFAPATGPRGEWPLNDQQLEQLKQAESHRKHIRNAASLFNLFFLLFLIGLVLNVIAVLLMLADSRGPFGRMGAPEQLLNFGLSVGLTVLCFFTARYCLKCQIWAPITMLVLFAVGAVLLLLFAFGAMAISGGRGPAPAPIGIMAVVAVFILILPAAFIYLCIRAIIAIPKFRASPVWCQEALVNAKL
jgi:amino acid transporter